MRPILTILPLLGLAVACGSTDISKPRGLHQDGNFAEAALAMSEIHPHSEDDAGAATDKSSEAKAEKKRDNLWLLVEKGKYHVDAGEWSLGRQCFREALGIIENLDEEAIVSLGAITSGTKALLGDDRSSDYVGSTYGRIMVPAYLSLCEMFLGNFDEAAVAARNMNMWQGRAQDARANLSGKAAEEDAAAAEEGASVTHANFLDSIKEDKDRAIYNENMEGVSEWATAAYADYSIPGARAMAAIALGAAGYTSEQGAMQAAVQRMVPACTEVRELSIRPGRVFVIFEDGGVPHRVDDSVQFAYAYTMEGKQQISIAKIAVPALAYEGRGSRLMLDDLIGGAKNDEFRAYRRTGSLRVNAGSNTHESQMVSSITGIVAMEFKEALPGIWFRGVARMVIQEAVQAVANKALADQGVSPLFGLIGGVIAKSFTEPDLRGWESLPAEQHLMVFEAPADGKLSFQLGDNSLLEPVEIEVPTDVPVLIFARATKSGVLSVYQTSLAPSL
jgi:hypothetical protein